MPASVLLQARAILALAVGVLALGAPGAGAAGAPVIESSWVTRVTATDLEARGLVNPNGAATSGRAQYISETEYQANVSAVPPRDGFSGATLTAPGALGSGMSPVELIRSVLSLQPETTYRYRIVATNGHGTTNGPTGWFRTEETAPIFSLPEGRAWELVSPIAKNGGSIQPPGQLFGGGVLQAAAGGSAVTYGSASFFGTPEAASSAAQYLSLRTAEGWQATNVTVPAPTGSFGDEPVGVPYQLFSADLTRAVVSDPVRCELGICPRGLLLRASADGTTQSTGRYPDLAFVGATADLSSVILSTCEAITPDATLVIGEGGACDPDEPNLYRWTGSALTLLNLLPGDLVGTPGARIAAPGAGSISADGTRVFFSHGGDLFLRHGSLTTQVDTGVGGEGVFEAANAAGSIVYISKSGHLYRHAIGGASTDLTPDGGFEGLLGISTDGAVAYFQTTDGIVRSAGASDELISGRGMSSNFPASTGTARVSANGGRLAFSSEESLTGFENHGHAEIFVYTAGSGALHCVSCNPTGERPNGPSEIPGVRANGTGPTATRAYRPRAMLADGSRLYFVSLDSLAPQDTNNESDVYQWAAQGVGGCQKPAGCISLISSGRSEEGATFVDASSDGSDVFFVTDGSLVGSDPGSVDLYDARVGGGFPIPSTPLPCIGDACQVVPPEPDDPTPGTALQRPEGNPPVTFPKNNGRSRKANQRKKKRKAKAAKRKARKRARRAAAKGGKR